MIFTTGKKTSNCSYSQSTGVLIYERNDTVLLLNTTPDSRPLLHTIQARLTPAEEAEKEHGGEVSEGLQHEPGQVEAFTEHPEERGHQQTP